MKPWQFFLLVSCIYGAAHSEQLTAIVIQFAMFVVGVIAYFKGPK